MTRPDDGARERRQRVSQERLHQLCMETMLGHARGVGKQDDDIILDLRDAREETTRLEAENAELRAALTAAEQERAEQWRLRRESQAGHDVTKAALATARRDGWIAGRNDVLNQVNAMLVEDHEQHRKRGLTYLSAERDGFVGALCQLRNRTRALAPDTVEGESDG